MSYHIDTFLVHYFEVKYNFAVFLLINDKIFNKTITYIFIEIYTVQVTI